MTDHILPWLFESPFIQTWRINHTHIDHYQHVNNVAYLAQAEKLAWSHSNALGLHFSDYQNLNRGMVIKRHELNYHLPAHVDNELECATWIVHCDKRLTLKRQFQFICPERKKTVFDAVTTFVCVSLDTGMPKRMPEHFRTAYGNACINAVNQEQQN